MALLALAALPVDAAPAGADVDAAFRYLAQRHAGLEEYAMEAAGAAGLDVLSWPSPESSLYRDVRPSPRSSADAAYKHNLRIAHGLGVAGLDPRDVRGTDFVALARQGYLGSQAYYNDDIWLILALRAAGVPADDPQVRAAAATVAAAQATDGGWSYAPGAESSPDMTGMALAALAAAGRDVRGNAAAKEYLDAARTASGGYPGASGRASCESTTWALHARALLGQPDARAVAFLVSLQQPDGGFLARAGDEASDVRCTTEALVYLVGGRYPLPGYEPGRLVVTAAHALEPARLRVEGNFTRATWRYDGGEAHGTSISPVFPTKGLHRVSVVAEGPAAKWRAAAVVDVLTARPRVAPLENVETLRHVPVHLPLAASDPDGRVVAWEVRWGDGNETDGAPHAYERPGEWRVLARALDDEGGASEWATVDVLVRNRAPEILDLPARLLADRVSPLQLSPRGSDPDGDVVVIDGPREARFDALGNHTLRFVARDVFGGETARDVVVEVVNLPPRIDDVRVDVVDGRVRLSAAASDDDGPAPALRWRVGDAWIEGPDAEAPAPSEAFDVVAEAVDADGGVARASRHVTMDPEGARVETPDEPPAAEPPRAQDEHAPPAPQLDAPPTRVRQGEPLRLLLVPSPSLVAYRFAWGDGAEGEWSGDTVASHVYETAGAFEVRVEGRDARGATSQARLVVEVEPRPVPAATPEPAAAPVAPPEETPAPLEGASVARVTPEARRESQLPWPLAALALLAGALSSRAGRA